MKLGRIITCYREDLILQIKDFYLGGNRTDFLVVAYNEEHVDPSKFSQTENFKLVPYRGRDANGGFIIVQWKTWPKTAAMFPEIGFWVLHDYDVLCKPSDSDIQSHIKENEYAMLGSPIILWQEGMPEEDMDCYPFARDYRYWKKVKFLPQDAASIEKFESVLKQNFPKIYKGIPTILCGYGDFLATSSKNLMLLADPRLEPISNGGIEQVPHSVFGYNGIRAVDLREYYSLNISMDNTLYAAFKNKFDISHSVKFWPQGNKPALKLRLKRFIKSMLYAPKGISYPKNS
jgi:hypothetical protein